MTLQQLIESQQNILISKKKKLEKLLSKAPDGTLVYSHNIVKNKSYYKWYVSKSSHKIYIPRKNRNLARELARKKIHLQQLKDINAQLKAIDSYLKNYQENSDLKKLLKSPPILNLLSDENSVPATELYEELKKWENEEYETNPFHPEYKTVKAINGLMVRSKSEAFIVLLLVTHHIPFRYECLLELDGKKLYPDFTIRHPVTGEIIYWEHCGMLDNPDYISQFINKMRHYLYNGIIPDHNLILTFESSTSKFDITIAEDKIKEFFSLDARPLY